MSDSLTSNGLPALSAWGREVLAALDDYAQSQGKGDAIQESLAQTLESRARPARFFRCFRCPRADTHASQAEEVAGTYEDVVALSTGRPAASPMLPMVRKTRREKSADRPSATVTSSSGAVDGSAARGASAGGTTAEVEAMLAETNSLTSESEIEEKARERTLELLNVLHCFLHARVRASAELPDPRLPVLSDDDDTSSSDGERDSSSAMESSVIIGHPTSQRHRAGGATRDEYYSGSPKTLQASIGNLHSFGVRPAGAASAAELWRGLFTASSKICEMVREDVFSTYAEPSRGTRADSTRTSISGRPSDLLMAGRTVLPSPLPATPASAPSAPLVRLRRAVMAHVCGKMELALGSQQQDEARQPSGVTSMSLGTAPNASDSVRNGAGQEDRTPALSVDRALLPLWLWVLVTIGAAEDPLFVLSSGDPSDAERCDSPFGFLVSSTHYLANSYAKSQLRPSAFSFASFRRLAGLDRLFADAVEDSSQSFGGSTGAPAADAAMLSAAADADVRAMRHSTLGHTTDESQSIRTDEGLAELGFASTDAPLPLRAASSSSAVLARSTSESPPALPGKVLDLSADVRTLSPTRERHSMEPSVSLSCSMEGYQSRAGVGDSVNNYVNSVTIAAMGDRMRDTSEDAAVNLSMNGSPTRLSTASPDLPPQVAALSSSMATQAPRSPVVAGSTSGTSSAAVLTSPLAKETAAKATVAPSDNSSKGLPAKGSAGAASPDQLPRLPPLSQVAVAEKTISRASKAIHFGFKLGTLYATQDMNALLALLPSSSAFSVPSPVATVVGTVGSRDGAGLGASAQSVPSTSPVHEVDGSRSGSCTADVLTPGDGEQCGPVSGLRGGLPLRSPCVSPSTQQATPTSYATVAGLDGREGSGGRSAGARSTSLRGAGYANAGAAGPAGAVPKLRENERRIRLRDLDDFAIQYISALHSPSDFVRDLEVSGELAFSLSIMLVNRVLSRQVEALRPLQAAENDRGSPAGMQRSPSGVTTPSDRALLVDACGGLYYCLEDGSRKYVCAGSYNNAVSVLSLLHYSPEVWRSITRPLLVRTLAPAAVLALDRQQVAIAQELADLVTALILHGSTTTEQRASTNASGTRAARMSYELRFPMSMNPNCYSAYPHAWLASFRPAADTAKHLLSRGHGSPKPLESATWYLAGMADYLGRMRILLPLRDDDLGEEQEIDAARQSGAATATPVQPALCLADRRDMVRAMLDSTDRCLEAIVSFMETLTAVFSRDVSEREWNNQHARSDVTGSRDRFVNVYRGRSASYGGSLLNEDDENYYMVKTSAVNAGDGEDADLVLDSCDAAELDDGDHGGLDAAGGGDPLREHYKWMELCVHYFLEIVDALLESALALSVRPLFLYLLLVGGRRNGPLDGSYVAKLATMAASASAVRRAGGDPWVSCGVPWTTRIAMGNTVADDINIGASLMQTRGRPLMSRSGAADNMVGSSGAFHTNAFSGYVSRGSDNDGALNGLLQFLDGYCSTVMQRALSTRFLVSPDMLYACGLLDRYQASGPYSGSASAPAEERMDSPAARDESCSQPFATAGAEAAYGGTPPQSSPRSTAAGGASAGRLQRCATMWWPNQPFQQRRHIARVMEHASLVSAFLSERALDGAGERPQHKDAEEQECLRTARHYCARLGAGVSIFFHGVSSMLDTGSGPCAQLLSLPCGSPVVAGPPSPTSAMLPSTSMTAISVHGSNRNSLRNGRYSQLARHGSLGLGDEGARTSGRLSAGAGASDRALLATCGGLFLRLQALHVLSAASRPIDRAQSCRFSRFIRGRLTERCCSGPEATYATIHAVLPYTYSVLPGTVSATYVRLLFLRIVQGFYSDRKSNNGAISTYSSPVMADAETGPSYSGPTTAAAAGTSGAHRPLTSSALGLAASKLWTQYMFELVRALKVLCWHHAEAHRTAITLSIPSVLSRFLQVVRKDEAAAVMWAGHHLPNSTQSPDDDDGEVGLLQTTYSGMRATAAPGGSGSAMPAGFRDFDEESDDADDDATIRRTAAGRHNSSERDREESLPLPSLADNREGGVETHQTGASPSSHDVALAASLSRRGSSSDPSAIRFPSFSELSHSSTHGDRRAARSPSLSTATADSVSAPAGNPGHSAAELDGGLRRTTSVNREQAPPLPPLPAAPLLPKLNLGSLGPPLYFASSGDTGAAQEQMLMLATPSTMTTRTRPDRRFSTPFTSNRNDDRESCVASPTARDDSQSFGALSPPPTPVPGEDPPDLPPMTPSALSTAGGEQVSPSTPLPSNKPPPVVALPVVPLSFSMPKLDLGGLGPALYFASSGDTGCFMEMAAAAPSAPPPVVAVPVETAPLTSPRPRSESNTTAPASTTASAARSSRVRAVEEALTAGSHSLSAPLAAPSTERGGGSSEDRRSAARPHRHDPVHLADAATPHTATPPSKSLALPVMKRRKSLNAPSTGLSTHSPSMSNMSVPGLCSVYQSNRTDAGADGAAVPSRLALPPPPPLNYSLLAELVLCLTATILQRDSGFVQYSFTVSSLTQKRAHVLFPAVNPPRMLYTQLPESSDRAARSLRSTSGLGGGSVRFVPAVITNAAAPAAPHGASTFHVVQELYQFLLQRSHAPVVDILEDWLERHYSAIVAGKFESEVLRTEDDGDRHAFAETPEEMHACLPFALGQYVLLRLLLPRRTWLRKFTALNRLGSGGFGSVMRVRASAASVLTAEQPGGECSTAVRESPTSRQELAYMTKQNDLAVKLVPLRLQGSESGSLPLCHSEVLAMLRLRGHPHIAKLLSFGCSSKEYFMLQPNYAGGSFAHWRLARYPPGCAPLAQHPQHTSPRPDRSPSKEAATTSPTPLFAFCAEAFMQVMTAVAHIHRHRIRHGDIKADNVFITAPDGETYDGEDTHSSSRAGSPMVLPYGDASLPSFDAPPPPFSSSPLRSVCVGDFGSCDTCDDDDLRALLRDLEDGEARFLAGRWGSGKGTEAIQAPEVMVPKRRFAVFSAIVDKHCAHQPARTTRRPRRHETVPGAGATATDATPLGGSGNSTVPPSPQRPLATARGTRGVSTDTHALLDDLRRAELAADIWGCGCLLYEMLTGRMLFGEGRLGRLILLANHASQQEEQQQQSPSSSSPVSSIYLSHRSSSAVAVSPTADEGSPSTIRRPTSALDEWERRDLVAAVGSRVVNLISRMLNLNPMERPTAEEALTAWCEAVQEQQHGEGFQL